MTKMRDWLMILTVMTALISCQQSNTNDTASHKDSLTQDKDTVAVSKKKTIVFFGNSITAGYGLDLTEAFPSRIKEKIDSMNLPYTVVNAGLSGETSAGGNSRIDWILKQPVDIFVLELGGNDGLRGIPIEETKKNLQSIIDKVKLKNPEAKIVITGMQMPPNMGKQYTTTFKSIYPELAKKNKASLVPFILEGVGGVTRLNQQDGIHPTAEGQRILANNVWVVLKGLL